MKRKYNFLIGLAAGIAMILFSLKPAYGMQEREFTTKAFILKYAKAQDLIEPVKKFLSNDGSVNVFDLNSSNVIVVQDSTRIVDEVTKLIAGLDTSIPPLKVTLSCADLELADVLKTLLEDTKMNIVSGKDLAGKVSVNLIDVPLENALDSILLSNGYTYIREGQIIRIIPLSEKRDIPVALVTEVFILKFTNADDIKSTVEKLLSTEGIIQTFSRTITPIGSSLFSASVGGGSRGASLTKSPPDILLIRDKPEVIQSVRNVIDKLDKEPPQIRIEAKFVDVLLGDTEKLGIDWTIQAQLTKGAIVPTTFPFMNNRDSIDQYGKFLPNPSPTTTDFNLSSLFPYALKGDYIFGALSFANFKATMDFLSEKDNTKIISAPSVSVLEGQEALINIGKNYPIPTYERDEQTGTMEISGYQDQKIGIILRVVPKVIGENKVMLRLHPEVSEIDGYTGPNNERPITSTKEVDTSVTINSLDTVVIGGLMKEKKVTKDHRVPFLGNIPFLGLPFRYKYQVIEKTELLIFVTPIITDRKNSEKVSLAK